MAISGGVHTAPRNANIVVRPIQAPRSKPARAWFSDDQKRSRRNHWTGATPDRVPPYPKYEPLSYLVETRLLMRAQDGDAGARNSIWETHLRLAVSAINRFSVPEQLLHDIVQEAAIGLHRAIEKFDVERYNAFSTYAWWWVSQSASRALPRNIYFARVPTQHLADIRVFKSWWESSDAFGTRLPMPKKHRQRLRQYGHKLLRIYRVCFPEPIDHTLPNIREHDDPIEMVWKSERDTILHAAIDQLDDRARIILTGRHGLDGRPERTLEDIATTLGITRERVRQIQQTAERRLKQILQQWPLRDKKEEASLRDPPRQFIEDLLA